MEGKYSFIKLERIVFRDFPLYKKNGKVREINEQIPNGVYCLAGANGLGKTTFISTINYALTGIVLQPNRVIQVPKDIVEENKVYTTEYFKGRLPAKNSSKPEVEIQFSINDKLYVIVRGFDNREELKSLEIHQLVDRSKRLIYKSKTEALKEVNIHFQNELCRETGFISFDYFMFFQLYVFTFDENRSLVFWDAKASSTALSVAFNEDPFDSERIASLFKAMESHESYARNARWQAKQATNRIDELTANIKGRNVKNERKLLEEFDKLNKEAEKFEKLFRNVSIEYDTMLKKQSHLNSEIMQFKAEHSKLFSKYSKPRSKLTESPNIQLSLKKMECFACGSHGSYVLEHIERNIQKEKCPLCDTVIKNSNSEEQNRLLKLIKKNDERIAKANGQLETLVYQVQEKQADVERIEVQYERAKELLAEFTEEYPDLSFNSTGDQNIDSLIDQHRKQFLLADEKSKAEYKKRDKLKPEYEMLLKKIESGYKEAELIFVPIFKKLAKAFIGLELNIDLQRSDRVLKLVVDMEDTARTAAHQLSESQRFFLDIALRMSLAIFLSNKKNPATLIIDTPEGSLDIAYESRVGNMFAEFVTTYNQNLLITANINASQLLISLATKCGKRKMTFKRMLDWTDLSLIQREGEALFKSIFIKIEKILNKKK